MSASGGPPFPDPSRAFTLATTALFVSLLPMLAGSSVVGSAARNAPAMKRQIRSTRSARVR